MGCAREVKITKCPLAYVTEFESEHTPPVPKEDAEALRRHSKELAAIEGTGWPKGKKRR